MLIDFGTVMKDYEEKAMKVDASKDAKDLKLGDVAIVALNAQLDNERNLDAVKKLHRGVLSYDIAKAMKKANASLDIPVEDVAEIKDMIAKIYNPLTIMRAFEVLDPKPGDTKSKEAAK